MTDLKQIKELIELSKLDELIERCYEDTLVLHATPKGNSHDPDPRVNELRDEIHTALKSLVDEVERLREWKQTIVNAPDAAKGVCIERLKDSESIKSIVQAWKDENTKQAEEIKRLREALESAGDVVEWEDGGACGTVRHIVEQALLEGGA